MNSYKELKEKITRIVIGQDKAVDQCLLFMVKHLLAGKLNFFSDNVLKANDILLLTGETGTGKTFLIKNLGVVFGAQVCEINSKAISQEAGWAGTSLNKILTEWSKAELDLEKLPELIIIHLDEFDKMCMPLGSSNTDNFQEHVQNSLLKYFEYNFSSIPILKDIPIHKIAFILSGNFEKLRQNRKIKSIGFNETVSNTPEITQELTTFGMLPEIAGRVSHIVELDFLTFNQYRDMWESDNFLVQHWTRTLNNIGLNPDFNSIKEYAIQTAVKKKLGVRGLIQEFNKTLNDFLLIHFDETLKYIDIIEQKIIKKQLKDAEEEEVTIEEFIFRLTECYPMTDLCWIRKNYTARFSPLDWEDTPESK